MQKGKKSINGIIGNKNEQNIDYVYKVNAF